MNQPLVKNAADEEQLKEAKGKVKLNRDTELNDLRFVLSSIQGRRLLWKLLSRCRVFGSIWEASAKIHYNAGMQDLGHYIQAEIAEASQDRYFEMLTEAKEGKI